ncbi:MAG: LptF/LptG family permease, partial [Planktomarina sp.]
QSRLQVRSLEVAENVTARLLTEGKFLTPGHGITFYLREISSEGQLESVFLNDSSTHGRSITYSASRAFLVRSDVGPRLVLIDGSIQDLDTISDRLTVTRFNDFMVNIGQLVGPPTQSSQNISNLTSVELAQLLRPPAGDPEFDIARISLELNDRFAAALIAIVAALIGFGTLISGGFSRFGIWRHVLISIILLIVVKLIEGYCIDVIKNTPSALPLIYLPTLIGLGLAFAMMLKSDRPWTKPGIISE